MPNNPNSQNNTNEFNQLIRHWGTTAQRPTTNLVLYQSYLNVDTPGWEYYNGSGWTAISGGGSSGNTFLATNSTGSTIAANKAVASGGGASLIVLADSGTVNDSPVVGFTTVSIPNGGTGLVQVDGVLAGFTGLTAQARYFSDPAVPGGIIFGPSFSTNAKYQVLGVAVNSTTLAIEIGQRVKMNASATQTNFLALNGNLMIDTPISITPTNNLGAIALQATSPGTTQTGNGHVSGDLRADGDLYSGDDVIAGDAVTAGGNITAVGTVQGATVVSTGGITAATTITATGTVQGATVTSTGAVNATTTINRAGIAMNNVTVLNQICRVLDDSTSRASGYANSAVQVSGATDLAGSGVTLPATLKACWFTFFILTAAATGIGVVVENPSFVVGASTMRGTTVQQSGGGNFAYSGAGVVSLNASGQLRFVYSGTANSTRIIVDIWAYSV